jgi:hypothetical protein
MSKSGYTGSTIVVTQVEIDAQRTEERELMADFRGNHKCTCPRCASVFQIKDNSRADELDRHLLKNGCPFCDGKKWTARDLNNPLQIKITIIFDAIEVMRLPDRSFKKPKTINGKWLDAKPKQGKGPDRTPMKMHLLKSY